MKAQLFYTADKFHPVSVAIRSASNGDYSHTGQLYTARPEDLWILRPFFRPGIIEDLPQFPDGLYRFYFESISTKDERTKKTGCRGPYPFKKLADWKNGHKNRTLLIQKIPMSDAQARSMMLFAARAVPKIKYAHVQIVRNWLGYMFGRGVPLRKRSNRKWTCVEFNVRAMAAANPIFAIKHLRLGDLLFDEYSPSGTRGPGLFEMIEQAGHRTPH